MKGRTIIILFILTNLVYAGILTVTIPMVMQHTDMKLLDMQPLGYSAAYAQELLDDLGEEGRYLYLTRQIPLDMIYPGLFAVTYALLLIYLLKKNTWLATIPILAGAFDYLENIGIVIMLSIYPAFSDGLAVATNIFTLLKSLFTTVFWIVLVYAIVVWVTLRKK